MFADSAWHLIFGMPQLPIILGCLIPIVAIIAWMSYETQKTRSENDLKRTMVERGMSVDEIERVLAARGNRDRK